jgi:hypothetical protein
MPDQPPARLVGLSTRNTSLRPTRQRMLIMPVNDMMSELVEGVKLLSTAWTGATVGVAAFGETGFGDGGGGGVSGRSGGFEGGGDYVGEGRGVFGVLDGIVGAGGMVDTGGGVHVERSAGVGIVEGRRELGIRKIEGEVHGGCRLRKGGGAGRAKGRRIGSFRNGGERKRLPAVKAGGCHDGAGFRDDRGRGVAGVCGCGHGGPRSGGIGFVRCDVSEDDSLFGNGKPRTLEERAYTDRASNAE